MEAYWDYMDPFPDQGMYRVRKDSQWGVIDINQNMVTPCRWERIGHFHENLIFVKDQGCWGILRTDGTMVLSCKWITMLISPEDPDCLILTGQNATCRVSLRSLL